MTARRYWTPSRSSYAARSHVFGGLYGKGSKVQVATPCCSRGHVFGGEHEITDAPVRTMCGRCAVLIQRGDA